MLSERLAGSSVVTQAEGGTPPVTTSESQSRIFYGWYIVLGALVAQFVAVGIQAGVSGVFLRPMTEDLGWTRAEFTIATSLGTGVSGMIGFFIGGYVDRVGARPLMVVGVTIVGATLLAISRVEELWQFVLLRGVLFTVGFVLVGNLVVNVTLSKWFVDRRGWAISLASLGTSAAGIVTPLVMVRVVDSLGWRDGWVVMGLGAWALIYPVALIMRRQPEDQGLLPDGRVAGRAGDEAGVERARLDYANSYTRGEAVRTLSMWLLILAFGFAMVGMISLLFHTIPFLTDNGYTRTDAAIVSASMGGSALVSKFAWGWVMQRFHPRVLAAVSFVIAGVSVLSMVPIAASGSTTLMFAAFMAWGWGVGGMIPLSEFIWASFYGRRYLGAVRSAGMPVTIIFGAAGPYFAGAYFDAVGSYDGALVTFALLWFVATVLVPRQPKPKVPSLATAAPLAPRGPAAFVEGGSPAEKPEPRPPVTRRRHYMGGTDDQQPVRDYMDQ
jgi:OFA family oxalate/formate antiporter-like MFS transporter